MKRARGFTLLELMIVVTVIAILAALAINSYQKQVRKSRRADAKSTLGDYALKLEKWRTNNVNYGVDGTTALSNIGGTSVTPGGYYTVAISFPSGTCAGGQTKGNLNSFIITATPRGDQVKDANICPTIVWTNDCGQAPAKTPVDCW